MSVGELICFICYVGAALLMIGIGIWQIRSKKPVGFYSGEEPPRESELSDVDAWNKKHGRMWVLYGLIIMVCYAAGAKMIESIWCLIPMCGGIMLPVPVLIWYHHQLVKRYRTKGNTQKYM